MLVCVDAHLTKRSKVALMFAGSVMCNKQAARRQLKLYDVDLDSVSFYGRSENDGLCNICKIMTYP